MLLSIGLEPKLISMMHFIKNYNLRVPVGFERCLEFILSHSYCQWHLDLIPLVNDALNTDVKNSLFLMFYIHEVDKCPVLFPWLYSVFHWELFFLVSPMTSTAFVIIINYVYLIYFADIFGFCRGRFRRWRAIPIDECRQWYSPYSLDIDSEEHVDWTSNE